MIDCHAHLADPCFDADREAVLFRAMEAGVRAVVVVGQDLEENRRVLEVCDHHDLLLPCAGLHPDRFADRFDDREPPSEADIEAVCAFARARAGVLVAIGEVGLDYWCAQSHERREAQRRCLTRMAALAAELDLPLNVHSRSAGRTTLELLGGCGVPRVLLHAFDGKAGHALRAFETHGWLFSVPPSVVRSQQKQRLVRVLPLEALALETDSPVLGPDREARNEPANVVHALRYIAETKNRPVDEVREITTANARRLFRLPGG